MLDGVRSCVFIKLAIGGLFIIGAYCVEDDLTITQPEIPDDDLEGNKLPISDHEDINEPEEDEIDHDDTYGDPELIENQESPDYENTEVVHTDEAYDETNDINTNPGYNENSIEEIPNININTGTIEQLDLEISPEQQASLKLWQHGVVPFFIDEVSFSDKVFRDKIRSVLSMVSAATTVDFVEMSAPPTDESTRWVFFLNRRSLLDCADHSVTELTNEGVQKVILGYDCIATQGEVAEAVMAILGIPAQHNSPDRDTYITVHLDNVLLEKTQYFDKVLEDEWVFKNLPYDFNSVTHYDTHKYTANGRATIEPRQEIAKGKTFSDIDIQKIRILYNVAAKDSTIRTEECHKMFDSRKVSTSKSKLTREANTATGKMKLTKSIFHNTVTDPLTYLSDYRTSDENNKSNYYRKQASNENKRKGL